MCMCTYIVQECIPIHVIYVHIHINLKQYTYLHRFPGEGSEQGAQRDNSLDVGSGNLNVSPNLARGNNFGPGGPGGDLKFELQF